jgi:hypothetical protein
VGAFQCCCEEKSDLVSIAARLVRLSKEGSNRSSTMALLEVIATLSALIAFAAALHPALRRLLLPAAVLGAASGIALGLLGAGQLWMTGGIALLVVGPVELVNERAFEALLADGQRAAMTALQPILGTAVSSAATVLFALA